MLLTVPIDKNYKLSDGGGLSLVVNPNGSKWWHFRYRFNGKEGKISLGVYPKISLEQARTARDKCQSELDRGINPSTSRKEARRLSEQIRINTFRLVSNKWLAEIFPSKSKSPDHAKRVRARFENDLFPLLGDRLMTDITTQDVLAAIQKIKTRGCLETAQRTAASCRDVFRYAKVLGYCQHDVTEGIFALLQRPVRAHFPAITKGELAAPLLQEIWSYRGTAVVQSAFRLNPYHLSSVSSSEQRNALASKSLRRSNREHSEKLVARHVGIPERKSATDGLKEIRSGLTRLPEDPLLVSLQSQIASLLSAIDSLLNAQVNTEGA